MADGLRESYLERENDRLRAENQQLWAALRAMGNYKLMYEGAMEMADRFLSQALQAERENAELRARLGAEEIRHG